MVKSYKKIPNGIPRQRKMFDIVERRFEQVEMIREAVKEGGEVTIRWHGNEEVIEQADKWIAVYDEVYRAGDGLVKEIMERRFRGESYWKTCDILYLSTGAYYTYVRDILHYAVACAVAYGIFDLRKGETK
jgi:hypothetical protein